MSEELRLQGMTTEHIPAWNRLLAAAESVDRTGEHYNEDDLVEEMANPDIDPAKDLIGAWLADEMVGYAAVYPRSVADGVHRVILDGTTAPAHRGEGIGTRLVTAMVQRAAEAHRERHPDVRLMLTFRGLSGNTHQADLMAVAGLVPERWSFVMRTGLADVPPPPPVPDGLELRVYDESFSQAMHQAHNAAFVDHPHFTPWTDAMWQQWVTDSRSFRPALSLVVVDPTEPGTVVAYLQTNEYDAYQAATGRREAYVAKVGTRREFRGRGLAGCLLGHALEAYRKDGFDEASLDVDSENPSGALGIYERAGFEVESRWTDYGRTVEAGAGLP